MTRGLDYQLWVQRMTGRWVLADRFGPQASWIVPPEVRAARAAVLPAALVRRKAWRFAVSSPAIPVTYPSLPAWVAHQPPAPLSLVKQDLDDPAKLGLLNWTAADGQYVLQTLGRGEASVSVHLTYAKAVLYATAANNNSVFASPASAGRWPGSFPWHILGGIPTDVSTVNAVSYLRYDSSSQTFYFRVSYVTTGGGGTSQIWPVEMQWIGGKNPWLILGA